MNIFYKIIIHTLYVFKIADKKNNSMYISD